MKNILVATDFSVPAENAAHYAIGLAKGMKADVTLLNAYKAPADAPMSAQVAWPLVAEGDLIKESNGSLAQLVDRLEEEHCTTEDRYCPRLTFQSAKGEFCQVVDSLVKAQKFDLVVMGMAGAGGLVQWVLGSNSRNMIDQADFPVLYIPSQASYKPLGKIAFATDLSIDDLEPLQYVCNMASTLDAEVVVYHVTSYEEKRHEDEQRLYEVFFKQIVTKLDLERVKFENIWHSDVEKGLNWINSNEGVGMIAMVHRQHGLWDKLFNGSYVHKLSRVTRLPLLIFQPCEKIILV